MAGSAASVSRRKRPSDADGQAELPSKRVKKATTPTTIVIPAGKHAKQVAEIQSARCNTTRYKQRCIPQCFACVRRRGGDTCRFQNVRVFLAGDGAPSVTAVTYVLANGTYNEYIGSRNPKPDFPSKWNEPLSGAHIERIKTTIATALKPTLERELRHLGKDGVVWRALEHDVRATCDACLTSIFSGTWMCRQCGREICGDCYERITEFNPLHTGPYTDEQKNLLTCMRSTQHHTADFVPTSRFTKPQLHEVVVEMDELLASNAPSLKFNAAGDNPSSVEAHPASEMLVAADAQLKDSARLRTLAAVAANSPPLAAHRPLPSSPSSASASSETSLLTPVTGTPPPRAATKPASPIVAQNNEGLLSSPSPLQVHTSPALSTLVLEPGSPHRIVPPGCARDRVGIPFRPATTLTDGELTNGVFREIWDKGRPLVVSGQLPKFRLQWTPAYFIEKYGSQPCQLVECQTERIKSATVGEFFRMFGAGQRHRQVLKLKDWPPSTDFSVSFPELFDDFSDAVPAPSYTRRDGALNIASHFPANTVKPDLGPKMYNALATHEGAGSMGSTRLHMDIADAVNVMMYAAHAPDATPEERAHPACAAWDLFRAEDSDKIREFLRQRFRLPAHEDPIHAQKFYIDTELRRALWEERGVLSYRVYQTPGDAVFIPAGCAHQVCNLADCIKVAADFVSPENVSRCATLTEEFRRLNLTQVWKEDVLQLRTMMWYAWMSCARPRTDNDRDAKSKAQDSQGAKVKISDRTISPPIVAVAASPVVASQGPALTTAVITLAPPLAKRDPLPKSQIPSSIDTDAMLVDPGSSPLSDP